MSGASRIAEQLDAAALARSPLARPFTDADPDLDLETAYAVQRLLVRARVERGARPIGAKLGLTSRAKQEQMNVSSPLYGRLTSDMLWPAGVPIGQGPFIRPRIEPEIGFLIGEPIPAPASALSVLAATTAVFAAIEIIDSRYSDFRFRLADVVADNASSAGLVVGDRLVDPAAAGSLRTVGCVLRIDGEVVATAAGAAVLGHPAHAVAWLVNELAARGESLPTGAIVLSGALTDAFRLEPGSSAVAEFDGLGSVEAVC